MNLVIYQSLKKVAKQLSLMTQQVHAFAKASQIIDFFENDYEMQTLKRNILRAMISQSFYDVLLIR